MSKIMNNVLESIGNTPMIRLNKMSAGLNADICAKLEYANPSGSLKDRVVFNIVAEAEKRGELKPGMILLEGTTGNTGIATCMVGAAKGYQVIIVMPEGMSEERKKTIRAYGAQLILTPGAETDVDLVLEEVQRIKKKYLDKVFEIGQFYRPDNVGTHYDHTAPEIWEQTSGQLDAFIMCQGTGGTVSGISRYLKEKNPHIKIYISEPLESPSLSEHKIGPHMIQGIADGLIPEILELDNIEGVIQVSSAEAIATAQSLAQKEGIFCGISSGANVAAAYKLAQKHPELKCIVTMLNDNGLRYLSTPLCGTEDKRQLLERSYALKPEDLKKLKQYQFEIIK